VQPVGVVPVDPAGDLPLHVASVPPGGSGEVDRFGLEQADGRLAQRVVEGVADGADGAGDPGIGQFRGQRQTYTSDEARAATYPDWLHTYNHHRPHTGIGGLTPAQRVHNLPGNYS
jgi:hypothetical protein